jgi:uncharacterized protein (DUF305 family)
MRTFLIAVLLTVLGATAACGYSTASPASPAASGQSAFNPTDAAWLQLMVPMTEHMTDALTLTADHSDDPALRRLAAVLLTEHRSDLDRLYALRAKAGLPDADVHAGHRMPGMVTQADLVVLQADHGAAFDRHLRPLLAAHLAQSVLLAHGEQTSGKEHGVRELAHAIELARTADRTRLDALG